jgi:hypothetical protein
MNKINKLLGYLYFAPLIFLWLRLWSKFYQFLFLRKYSSTKLFAHLHPHEAQSNMNMLQWKPDGWKELKDVIVSAEYVQVQVNRTQTHQSQLPGPLDCDDFAIWASKVVMSYYNPRILLVSYIKSDDSLGGHAVCLCRDDNKFFHIGNWGHSIRFYREYDVINDIFKRSNAKKFIGWAILDKNLKLKKWSRKLK